MLINPNFIYDQMQKPRPNPYLIIIVDYIESLI